MVKSKKKKNRQEEEYCPDYMFNPGGNMPPWMGGPCPDDMWGPGEEDMPPWMGGPCPDGAWGHGEDIPPWMGGPCPDGTWGPREDMPPRMGGSCPDGTWGPRGDMPPWMRDACLEDTWEPRGDVLPQMRGPCPDPRENVSSGPNAPGRRQCGTSLGPGAGGPRKPSGRKQPMGRCDTTSRENGPFPPGNCSSGQPASGNTTEYAAVTRRHSTEESAARILSNFGLSPKDLEEFGHYSDEELKPENMAVILRDIVERKKARQLPSSPSQGREEENACRPGGSGSLMKGPVVPSAAQPAMTPAASFMPQSSVSRSVNCPTPLMMNDYHAVSPRVFPHLCSLCKIECANMAGWNLHVGSSAHSEKCDQLRQQYPDWNPEDCSLLQRHEGDKKEDHISRPCSTSSSLKLSQQDSSPGPAWSQTQSLSRSPGPCGRKRSRSRSSERCKRRRSRSSERSSSSSQSSSSQKRELESSARSPASSAEAGSSKQPPAKSDVAEQPPNKLENPLQTHPDLQEPPKKEAATQEQGDHQREELLRLALMPLAEQSIMQALSLLQSGGAGGSGLAQGTSLPSLPSVPMDPASLSLGLVSMMKLVATQVVQAALASKEVSSVQTSPGVASPSPRLKIPAGSEEKKQENSQEVVPEIVPPGSSEATSVQEHPGMAGPSSQLRIPTGSEEKKQGSSPEVVPAVLPPGSARVDGLEASASKGKSLAALGVLTVPWLQKQDAPPLKQNPPEEICAGGWDGGKRVRVLITGHSMLYWASRRAMQSGLGPHLGLRKMASVQWVSRNNFTWDQLLPTLLKPRMVRSKPDIVVVHADSREPGLLKIEDIVSQVLADLEVIRKRWPGVVILWSNILPRRVWSGNENPEDLNESMNRINNQVKKVLLEKGDGVLFHPQIFAKRKILYKKDGNFLSGFGNDIFLSSLCTGIKANILQLWGKKD